MTNTEVVESTEIVPVTASLVLAAPVHQVEAAQEAYHELCRALLDDSDYQKIGDTSFRKKSGWRKLAVAYNVSCALVSEDFTYDQAGHISRAKYIVRATAPNGRFMDGVGLCDSNERCCNPATCKLRTHWEDSGKPTGHVHCEPGCDGRHAFSKIDHDIPATAHTRATNRACADLFGLGEVSAEEVSADQRVARQPSRSPSQRQTLPGGPTAAQMSYMAKLIDLQGLGDAGAIKEASDLAERPIGDLAELTTAEASKLIDYWKGGS